MTNYNDGQWHEISVKSRPVQIHSESEVLAYGLFGRDYKKAHQINWGAVEVFKVVKKYCGPLELWVNVGDDWTVGIAHLSKEDAVRRKGPTGRTVHMREVMQ